MGSEISQAPEACTNQAYISGAAYFGAILRFAHNLEPVLGSDEAPLPARPVLVQLRRLRRLSRPRARRLALGAT